MPFVRAIEELYLDDLREELGDLLLQVVFHSRMAQEAGLFDLQDVIDGISSKMIRRHPHVFGDEQARSAKLAKGFWEEMKARERKDKPKQSTLAGIPAALPGLTRADQLADRLGMDPFEFRRRNVVVPGDDFVDWHVEDGDLDVVLGRGGGLSAGRACYEHRLPAGGRSVRRCRAVRR